MQISRVLQNSWLRRGLPAWLLVPFALMFAALVAVRRGCYRLGWLQSKRLPVPVVVIGNITAGGSGKTPLTLWLAQRVQQAGWQPGIVSRGYVGLANSAGAGEGATVCEVHANSDPLLVGDEPVLLRRRFDVPVFVGSDRVAAAQALLAAYPHCDMILCDDGLQHYHLARDAEIAVLDRRGIMNGWPLPAGPLREPASRLRGVDALVLNDWLDGAAGLQHCGAPLFHMQLTGSEFYRLDDPRQRCDATALKSLRLAAVAGIGAPERFFEHLAQLGLACDAHAFPDHHRFCAAELAAIQADALLMTEKDAVKCAGLSNRPVWVLPISAQIAASDSGHDLVTHIENCLLEKWHGFPPA